MFWVTKFFATDTIYIAEDSPEERVKSIPIQCDDRMNIIVSVCA